MSLYVKPELYLSMIPNGKISFEPENFISLIPIGSVEFTPQAFMSVIIEPETNLPVIHHGKKVSVPFYGKIMSGNAAVIYHNGRKCFNRLVARRDEAASPIKIFHNEQVQALSTDIIGALNFGGSEEIVEPPVDISTLKGVTVFWLPFDQAVTYDVFGDKIENSVDRHNFQSYGTPKIQNGTLQLDGSSFLESTWHAFGDTDFTFDCWAKLDSSAGSEAWLINIPLVLPSYFQIQRYGTDNQTLQFRFRGDYGTDAYYYKATPTPLTERFHLAVVCQHAEKTLKLYFNGTCIFTHEIQYTTRISGTGYYLGGYGDTNYRNAWKGTLENFRYILGVALWTENFTPPDSPADYLAQMGRLPAFNNGVTYDGDNWIYQNDGTPETMLCGMWARNSPKILSSTFSTTGTAFYQTTRAKCFDLPATNEIWAKFDVYFDGSNRWRAYNATNAGVTGITAQTSGDLSFFADDNNIQQSVGICQANQLQTVLLHMISHATAGVVEAWVDGNFIYRYTGDINHGEPFENFYLQSDGDNVGITIETCFSNVTISNVSF